MKALPMECELVLLFPPCPKLYKNSLNPDRTLVSSAALNYLRAVVSNSIDAGATSVEVKVDLPSYRITVVDNGRGIPAETLRSLTATERASSKANSAVEMQHASTYGFRGEALYSLALTSLLEIQSRCAGKEPHAKVVREGEVLHFGPSRAPVRAGTIVTLRDAFFKWPVRRKAANEVTEMTRIKDCVSRMALVNNSVAITVRDSAKSKVVVRATATGSATRTFAQVFSSDKLSLARKVQIPVCVTSSAVHPLWRIHLPFCICSIGSSSGMVAFPFSTRYDTSQLRCVPFMVLLLAVNAAFAPCMALLAGRGGADGQGVVRRVRNPNASSGQRQELFPVFVLNLECPRSEVDIMSDPEKTWVEFSDWAAARNACISMLLAFLSRFSHAVPSSVLRDLRRAFHKNEGGGGDAWKPASPPPPPAARGASPDPGPSPSPPPMQLGTPDVGVSPAGVGSPLESCAWMGRDREVGGIGEEAMEFQDQGFRGEGVLYPSPASRFGARDTGPSSSSSSRMPGLSFSAGGGVGDDNLPGSSSAAVSPYFAASFEDDGKSRYHEGYDDDGHPTSSPYFARCHHYDVRRRSPPDNRLRGRQLALGEYTGGEEERRRRRWDPRPSALGAEAAPPYPAPSFAAVRYEGLGIEDKALSDQARGSGGHADSSGGGWAAEGPPGGRRMSDLLPPSEEEEPVFDEPPPPNEISCSAKAHRGNGRHSSRSDGQRWQSGGGGPPPPPSIAGSTRGSRRGGWLRHVPGVTEMRPGEKDLDQGQQQLEDDAADRGSLSRLFDYAFADSDGRRLPTGPERTGALDEWGVRGGVRSSSPRLLPRSEGGGGGGTAAGRKAFVGVTVRRPPSPQFAFMNEERSSPGGAGVPPPAPSSPRRQRSPPPEDRQRETLPPPSRENGGGGGARTCNPVNQQQVGARTRSPARATTSPHQSSGGFSCQGDGDTPGAWGAAPAFGGTAPLGSARRMASSSSSPKTGGASAKGGTPPLSKKRRRPETPGSSWGGADRRGSPSTGRLAGHRMEDAERHRSPPPPASDRWWGVVNNSPGGEGDGDGGVGLGDGWLGWTRGHGRARNSGGGWWGRSQDDTPPSAAGDRATPAATPAAAPAAAPAAEAPAKAAPAPAPPAIATAAAAAIAPAQASATATEAAPAPAEAAPTAAVARLLQADNDGLGWHDDASPTPRGGTNEPRHHPEHVGAASQAGVPPRRRDERFCAADGESLGLSAQGEAAETMPGEASVYNKESDQTVRPAPAGRQQNACRVEGGGGRGGARSSKEDRMRAAGAALAYDQDVLGGDGLGGDGEEEEEPDTVDGVLGKFLATGDYDSCHVSDAGGAAVYSPQGPGGDRARKAGGEAEKAAPEKDSRYNPLPGRRERQIPQVLQAGQDEVGAGAGAVAVTVTPEELSEALLIGQAGRKFILLRAKTGAVLCLDQHAADERVKLEELERQVFGEGRERRNVERLLLDPPEKLSITRSDAELLEEHREVLSSWQFEVRVDQAQQGGDGLTPVVTLTAVPMVCGVRLSVQDFVGFLHFLRESVEPGQSARRLRPPQVQHILNYKACHSAIRQARRRRACIVFGGRQRVCF
ncbi:MutL protein homolog 3 [Ectocarpus siliculosus]|uniref:MutL protein homolog 3 n=1 Tax=Ectocarpus siliculosus TaxID=2880 RepID=D7G9D8_ECTSI|nr:MutL protein homolog 3 [Ectocarpus siliculosus]|eukprot:CBJ28278.1 MutL protein homolog 3 [Ectocarpus siliculosus]